MFSILINIIGFVILVLSFPYIIALVGIIISFFINICVRLFMVFLFIYEIVINLYEKFGLLFVIVLIGFVISAFIYIKKRNN